MLHKENMAIMRMHRWPIWPCFFTHSIFSIKNLLKYEVTQRMAEDFQADLSKLKTTLERGYDVGGKAVLEKKENVAKQHFIEEQV